MGSNIIIGGGLTGLFIAKSLLKKNAKNIIIVEKSNKSGGLLKSEKFEFSSNNSENYFFDLGTHFVLSPKDQALYNFILEDINEIEYYRYEKSLLEGHVINNRLNDKSGCADVKSFSKQIQKSIENEILILNKKFNNVPEEEIFKDVKNLNDYFLLRYGKNATKNIFNPSYEKFTGLKSENLNVDNKFLFAPERLILYDRKKSKTLKNNPNWDFRIAFSDCMDSDSDIIKFYPKFGGINKWIKDLEKNLSKKGVKFLFNSEIKDIYVTKDKINSIKLSNKKRISCENLYWTIPAVGLTNLIGIKTSKVNLTFRKIIFVHYLVDKRPTNRPYWIVLYDKKFLSYRVTLYDNFAPSGNSLYRITVEVIKNVDENLGEIENKIFNELKTSTIIPNNTKKIWSTISHNSPIIPIYKPENIKPIIENYSLINDTYNNLHLVGNKPDGGHGQINIIKQILDTD